MAKMKKNKNMHQINGGDSPLVQAGKNTTPGFKKGGKVKDGGIADGMAAAGRADKKPRRASGGRTPYSSGKSTSRPEKSGSTNSGHQSERPPMS